MKDSPLLVLLRCALWEKAPSSFPVLTGEEWDSLLGEAKRQTVTGLVYAGAQQLPDSYSIPEEALLQLVSQAERIEREGRYKQKGAERLPEMFGSCGVSVQVLKGPEVAKFYPQPLLREYGDLDLYGSDPARAAELVRRNGHPVTLSPDGSFQFRIGGVDVDFHAQYYDLHTRSGLPEPGTPEGTLLMLSAHVLKHAMGTGIGLRQLCDVAMAYHALPYDPDRLLDAFRKSGTLRWNRLLSAFLHEYLGAENLPFTDFPSAAPLARIVFEGGNFGHYADARLSALQRSPFRRKTDTLRRFLARLPFSLRYAPRELFHRILSLARGNL